MKQEALKILRQAAVYFVAGEWPAIIQSQLPEGCFKDGKKYAMAILELED